ncbi:MAG: pyridoxal phosphate-dependent class II aminotransferase [Tannerella sp.]|jgi:threonine-phosphate decarboxylase|nr:pyridoxal phosphate-dependent class II aminotransferase [Tannerella sp.]
MLDGHGDDVYRYDREIVSNFSSNVYNQTDLSGLKKYLSTQLGLIATYPHPEAASLQQKIAAKNAIPPGSVCVTNGSIESIYLIAQAFQNMCSGILIPTFSEYADACNIHKHQVKYIYTLDGVGEFDVVWLCNPNNPTGRVYDKIYLMEVISRHPDVCFVLDQVYESFVIKPVFSSAEAMVMPNVILLHSLTKKYAIPGLRLGYVTAHEDLVCRLRMQRMPWSVNSMAIAAGHYLLDQDGPLDISSYLREKERLFAALQSINDLDVFHSDTHFMLLRLRRGKAVDMKEFLANEYGILIRDASNFQGLNESYVRIATQTPAENNMLVEAVREWFAKP